MYIAIFGRENCPFCVKAKALAERLQTEHSDITYGYTDIIAAGISKEDLEAVVKAPVNTVPQVMIDGESVGGYTEFAELIGDMGLI